MGCTGSHESKGCTKARPTVFRPGHGKKKLPPHCNDTTLFLDSRPAAKVGAAQAGGRNLLGRYDVVCVKVCADFDSNWRFIEQNRSVFWVLHAAAVNIGESANAPDFNDFRCAHGLDDERYIQAMGQIMDNIVTACNTLGIVHMILFPFGMGAFLRQLALKDPRYADVGTLWQLRRGIAARFIQSVKGTPANIQVHVALTFGGEEGRYNGDAYVRALMAADQSLKGRVTVYEGFDAFHLAHNLAATCDKVALVNGANRNLLGNHWFNGMAKQAIDENLHRRSWTMSALSYALNGYGNTKGNHNRQPDQLQKAVLAMSGKVYKIP
eukprot:gnl/TRDRNA2_/TRDRNA2_175781_c1_seq12.p1 gnl/TRDRNA2_/TRDRNA2_175781_c1~~gnl/TRDRNA2_/TRDRNA2_175781_c1_seq12.p1  ORF type:complete len:324 (+),score=39.85 gnl/TRDRNA2_/TRDRNA2_175781_c1_seq12:283-1254(+)